MFKESVSIASAKVFLYLYYPPISFSSSKDIPDDFRVEEFYVAPAAKESDEDVPAEVYASSGKYIDPDLHDLLFVRYLEERGFDAQFCKTLVAYATHYEHSQYVGLLNKIKAFVSK
ncbi:unnamed protein product [Strongylus vulgaris]|uniref:Uncharacterized protein n=1 Tax=Strongylus vulgaris TaxID=40348 RepID=A0A3P7KGS4_STRVU|nr:unnamed protein product [Strongylus vulgaris]